MNPDHGRPTCLTSIKLKTSIATAPSARRAEAVGGRHAPGLPAQGRHHRRRGRRRRRACSAARPGHRAGRDEGPPAEELRRERRRHPQLRADARVPRGRVLQRRPRPSRAITDPLAKAFLGVVQATRTRTSSSSRRRSARRPSRSRRSTSGHDVTDQAKFAGDGAGARGHGRRAPTPARAQHRQARRTWAPRVSILSVEARHAAWRSASSTRRATARRSRRAARSTSRPRREEDPGRGQGHRLHHRLSRQGDVRRAARPARRSKCVMRCSSATRPVISSAVSRATRSVPNSSTLKEASAVP